VDSTSSSDICFPNITSLDIPGSRDAAVRRYSVWQQSNVDDEEWKQDIQMACDEALRNRLDLEMLYTAQEHDFFVRKGVKRGVAWRFINNIPEWAKRLKQSHD
jgi:hypothetical protein